MVDLVRHGLIDGAWEAQGDRWIKSFNPLRPSLGRNSPMRAKRRSIGPCGRPIPLKAASGRAWRLSIGTHSSPHCRTAARSNRDAGANRDVATRSARGDVHENVFSLKFYRKRLHAAFRRRRQMLAGPDIEKRLMQRALDGAAVLKAAGQKSIFVRTNIVQREDVGADTENPNSLSLHIKSQRKAFFDIFDRAYTTPIRHRSTVIKP